MKIAGTVLIALAALILSVACIVYAAGVQGHAVASNTVRSTDNGEAIGALRIDGADTMARIDMMERYYAQMHREQTAALKSLSDRVDKLLLREP